MRRAVRNLVLMGRFTLVVPPPIALAYTPPFTVSLSRATYTHNFNPDAVKPATTVNIYCGAGGDNSANGLTWATRVRGLEKVRDLLAAMSSSDTAHVIVQAGSYYYSSVDGGGKHDSFGGGDISNSFVFEVCDAAGTITPGGKVSSIHNETMPAFSLVSGSVYVSTYTTQAPNEQVWDNSLADAYADPQALHNAPGSYANEAAIVTGVNAMHTLYGHGACYLDTVNKKLYVRAFDGRAPDASIIVGRGTSNTNGANTRNLYLSGRFGGTQQVWARGLNIWGGSCFYIATYQPDGRGINGVFVDCSSNYSCVAGINADGAYTLTFLRHRASYAYKDGYNYDQSAGLDVGGVAVGIFHELDCVAYWSGNSSTGDDSDNASSCHFRVTGVRVNCVFDRTLNRAVHDIAQAKTWNAGVTVSNCRQTGVQSGAFAAGFDPTVTGQTGTMWLDGCKSINNGYALEAYRSATLLYARMTTIAPTDTANGGTIATYNPLLVIPGTIGNLSASSPSSTTALLAFTAPANAVSYEYRLNGGAAVALPGDLTITGLSASTLYNVEVRALSATGRGAWSNVASVTTQASATPTNVLTNGNGDFTSGTAGWSGFGFSGKSVSGGKATFVATPAFDGISAPVSPIIAGKYYEITYTLAGVTGTIFARFLGGTTVSGTAHSTAGTYTERLLAVAGNNSLNFLNTTTFTGTIGNVIPMGPYNTSTVGGA